MARRARRTARTPSPAPPAPSPEDFEKLGAFYLGRPYDLDAGAPRPGIVLYDSRDLVTHAVCVGMTGSGKTGLCLALIEEAALDGVPAIVIDPKGDLGNLLLTFPSLAAPDFRPWIDEEEARRRQATPDDFAAAEARRWAEGLAAWGQDARRIARLREAADMAIYTPGSTAGLPVSILGSFAAPPAVVRDDEELLRERVSVTASSLLGLLGIEADPVKSREHILLSLVLQTAWAAGRDLDVAEVIRQVQQPPVERVGVLDLESFFPGRERFELAMAINKLIGAPAFSAWTAGEPLDPAALLHTAEGRPRVSIVSIAHLSDAERMFVVSLLLDQVVAWMRGQAGSSSLRAILYMDEIFGFLPPVANPPSKQPMLTLLKQARAYGLGVVLATQNPVDLDYKALSNAGTWFLGRLQTERDKARVLEGLESAAAGAGPRFDRAAMDSALSRLRSRVFVLHDVHEDAPEIFESRWAMSYLRGPLTRAQIKTLMSGRPPAPPAAARPAAAPAMAADAGQAAARPLLPPDVAQTFLPVRAPRPEGARLVYAPVLVAAAQVRYADARKGIDATEDVVVTAPLGGESVTVDWSRASEPGLAAADLEGEPAEGASFAAAPPAATRTKSYDGWRRECVAWIVQSRPLTLLRSPSTGLVMRPGESERDFRARVSQAAHEARDAETGRLRKRYAPRIAALQERLRRAEQAVERERREAAQSQLQSAISIGATLIGAFLGRKAVSASTLGRATTAARGVSRVLKDRQDIARAGETVEALREQLAALEAEFRAEVDGLAATDPTREVFEQVPVRAARSGVGVRLVALGWAPHWQRPGQPPEPAWLT